MKFGYTILYVEDVTTTVNFYEKAFDLKRAFVHESNQYAEMQTGATKLAFASFEMAKLNVPQFANIKKMEALPPAELAFIADDVELAFNKAVSAGALEIKKPMQKPWGQIVGYVTDCNGFLVEICSSME